MSSGTRANPLARAFTAQPAAVVPPTPPATTSAPPLPVPADHIDPAVTERDLAPIYQPRALYSLRLQLPGASIQPYADRAALQHLEPEDVMQRQLVDCASHTAERALYLGDADRLELERYLDASISSPRQLLDKVRRLVESVGTSGIPELRFTPQQIERVSSRCVKGETFADKLQEYCNFGINTNTGLD